MHRLPTPDEALAALHAAVRHGSDPDIEHAARAYRAAVWRHWWRERLRHLAGRLAGRRAAP